ncbi:hypothetical protein [Pararhodonellum marinum]|uniref:hypothetical protein n=1 Tax=Pararhodonellum marinum TaxID=2755358 RepID=UPI00188ED044|nr:hypothetical protein [Pararhodonellum marinum]
MKILSCLLLVMGYFIAPSFAQEKVVERERKVYTSSGGEWIFSSGTLDNLNNVVRFSPVFNFQNLVNFDETDRFGWFTGLNLRNVGFIYDESPSVRKKARVYNLGIPLGVKVGDLSNRFLFFGYELEMPLNYKEKTFTNERRTDRFNVWFSDRVRPFQHSLMVGMGLPKGTSIKFKYYFSQFYNRNFQQTDANGITSRPYEDLNVNIFYVSLNFSLFRNTDFYYLDK